MQNQCSVDLQGWQSGRRDCRVGRPHSDDSSSSVADSTPSSWLDAAQCPPTLHPSLPSQLPTPLADPETVVLASPADQSPPHPAPPTPPLLQSQSPFRCPALAPLLVANHFSLPNREPLHEPLLQLVLAMCLPKQENGMSESLKARGSIPRVPQAGLCKCDGNMYTMSRREGAKTLEFSFPRCSNSLSHSPLLSSPPLEV
mmetsp:Transcript_27340/g.63511  ORF Transcript_27340/g.63511 Transcript_27340/m.63511 type:complete len:200 (+) Transcript_27340:1465-2064(+)